MAGLSNDLTLEIISKLPPRNIFRCKFLNKFFYESISDPSFIKKLHSSTLRWNNQIYLVNNVLLRSPPDNIPIFNIIDLNTRWSSSNFTARNKRCDILVKASSNGILLLRTRCLYGDHYIVFNPITGGIAIVSSSCDWLDTRVWRSGPTGLITSSHSFMLVEVLRRKDSSGDLIFFVHSEDDHDYIGTYFHDLGFHGFADNHKSVYLDGNLHWLGKNGQQILVFNVETKEARIIKGPVIDTEFRFFRLRSWFGVAYGSLSFVYSLREQVVIFAHDYVNNKWQIQHKYVYAPCVHLRDDINPYHGFPVFYDGQHLFFQLRNHKHEEIYMFDGSMNRWTKIGMVLGRNSTNCPYIQFTPTLAKVSDVYLHDDDPASWKDFNDDDPASWTDFNVSKVKENLLELQKHISIRII